MSRGPLPDAKSRRRNAPTIPTTSLPVSGRKGRPPAVPASFNLGEAGQRWWKWAWTTPQAVSWDKGAAFTVARRAELEDDLRILGSFDPDSLEWLFSNVVVGDLDQLREVLDQLGFIIGRLKSLAGGKLAVMKEMRELESQLGLGPKALAALRWKIVADEAKPTAAAATTSGTAKPKRGSKKKADPDKRRLYAVDTAAGNG